MSEIAAIDAAPGRARIFHPNWHNPTQAGGLDEVLSGYAASFPERAHIADFILPRVPRFLLCSTNLKTEQAASARLPIHAAIWAQWVSWNTRSRVNALTVDCDHDEWRNHLRHLIARGIPEPTVITSSPERGTAHITWFFAIGLNRSNPGQMRLFQGIKDRLNRELDGDPNFKNHLGKNPLHAAYSVHSFRPMAYELSEFLDPLEAWSDKGDYVLPPRLAAQHEGRSPGVQAIPRTIHDLAGQKGSRVFWMAVEMVRRLRTSDLPTIRATFERVAADLKSPATAKQLDGMASRCAVWMAKQPWANGRPVNGMARPGIDHGAMTREAEQAGRHDQWIRTPKAIKLPLAAARTNELRKGKTRTAILEAVQRLFDRDEIITQSSLAAESGLYIKTIKRAWKDDSIFKQEGVTRSYPYCAASQPEGQGEAITLSSISLHSKIEAKKRDTEVRQIQEYEDLTARMMKRGARPESVPPRGPGASPEVESAHRAALAARKDAIRRQEARIEREDMKARREETITNFQTWAQAGDRAAFQAFYEQEMRRWDALELLIDPSEKEQIRGHLVRKFSYLKKLRTEWNRARQGGLRRQAGVRRTPDFLDSRASKICVPRMVEDRSYVLKS